MKRGSAKPEESIVRTAPGLYVGDLINERRKYQEKSIAKRGSKGQRMLYKEQI